VWRWFLDHEGGWKGLTAFGSASCLGRSAGDSNHEEKEKGAAYRELAAGMWW
jgi:hypothetical protein